MPIGWNIFRIICLLQMLATVFLSFTNLISIFNTGDFQYLLQTIAFMIISSLPVLALSILNSNYPDKPVVGRQKSIFNWLFLLNFLLLAFLFAFFFSALRNLQSVANLVNKEIYSLPFSLWIHALICTGMLLFHLIILYGLYILRRILYINQFEERQFEFEGKEQ